MVPGGGWSVAAPEIEAGNDMPQTDGMPTVPVVAWIITDMGTAVPLVPSPTPTWRFRAEPADENIERSSPGRLIPPGAR
ncbi:hypothetical protein GCM10009646_71940 [Streptomyces aureus]